MNLSTDFLIIGGGISGLLTARELRLAGHQVTLIDQSSLGQESSWAGGGILLPIYPWRQSDAIAELVSTSIQQYPTLCAELHQASGIDPEWYPCGLLSTRNSDYVAAEAWCHRYQIAYHDAQASQLNDLNCESEHPLWLPEIAQVRNPRLLKSLRTYIEQLGVRILENTAINHIAINQQRINQITTNHQTIQADQVLLCTGAWSQQFLKRWSPDNSQCLEIQPVRGQMLLFDAQPNTLPFMVLHGDHYLIPRRDGKILAGSTVEHVGFEKTTTEQAKQSLYQFATDLLPALKAFNICNHWAGLRPGSPEGIPYIDRHPEIKNLAINAGHFRNGLCMGPASARLLADLVLQRPLALDPAPYAIQRPRSS